MIGLANPELAPYGTVSKTGLIKEKLWNRVEDRLVFGSNVVQSFQYAATGTTKISFISLSMARTARGKKGCSLPVPEFGAVAQSACLVRSSMKRSEAERFLSFITSPAATNLLEEYGYQQPIRK